MSWSELNYFSKSMVNQMPILCKIHGAETVLVGTLDEIEGFFLNAGLGIYHNPFCRECVRNVLILLIANVTGNLGDVIAAKFLYRFKTSRQHFFIILGIEDNTLSRRRIIQGHVGNHFREHVFVICFKCRELEMNNGAFDDRILLGTFLTVEVEKKRCKDCIQIF